MKVITLVATGMLAASHPSALRAQIPAVLGTWKLNIDASKLPSPKPQMQVRGYRLLKDGLLMGVAVTIDDRGQPNFLQFVAKPDGRDYHEFSTDSAADYLRTGAPPPRTYSEMSTGDPRKVRWLDKLGGRMLFSGERWVSSDGKIMSFTVNTTGSQGESIQYLYVFDRTGE